MKKIVVSTLTLVASMISLSAQAGASAHLPYIGFSSETRQLELAPGFGGENFAKRLPETSLLLGYRMNDYFSLEIGHQFGTTITRTTGANSGEILFGTTIPALENLFTENRIKTSSTYASLYGSLPLNNQISLNASAGFALFKSRASFRAIGDENGLFLPQDIFTRHFPAKRIIPQFGGGLSLALTKQFTLRFDTRYQLTSKLKHIRASEVGSAYQMSYKNNLIYSLGLIYQIR